MAHILQSAHHFVTTTLDPHARVGFIQCMDPVAHDAYRAHVLQLPRDGQLALMRGMAPEHREHIWRTWLGQKGTVPQADGLDAAHGAMTAMHPEDRLPALDRMPDPWAKRYLEHAGSLHLAERERLFKDMSVDEREELRRRIDDATQRSQPRDVGINQWLDALHQHHPSPVYGRLPGQSTPLLVQAQGRHPFAPSTHGGTTRPGATTAASPSATSTSTAGSSVPLEDEGQLVATLKDANLNRWNSDQLRAILIQVELFLENHKIQRHTRECRTMVPQARSQRETDLGCIATAIRAHRGLPPPNLV